MNNRDVNKAFQLLSTPLIADACLRLKLPLRVAPLGIHPIGKEALVFADDDGVVFAPARQAEKLLFAAHVIWRTERQQAEAIESGRTLREQLRFEEYLSKRSADPAYTFRRHLRQIGGAIEE